MSQWKTNKYSGHKFMTKKTKTLNKIGSTRTSELPKRHVRTREEHLRNVKKHLDRSLSCDPENTGVSCPDHRLMAVNDMTEILENKGFMVKDETMFGGGSEFLTEGNMQLLAKLTKYIRNNARPTEEMADYLRVYDFSVRKGT